MARSSTAERHDDETSLPHPKENPSLFGHEKAEEKLLDLLERGRLPHSILITGGKGIGKATLAYRLARHLLTRAKENNDAMGGLFGAEKPTMAMSAESPTFRRVIAGSHGDMLALEPAMDEKKGERKRDIVVDDVRKVGEFLSLTPAESNWRVVVVDSVDEMNVNAANALLKVLEEPPAQAVLILVSHNPGKLLPTIRSRCHVLKLTPISPQNFRKIVLHLDPDLSDSELDALYQLSEASPGMALELSWHGAIKLYQSLVNTFSSYPQLSFRQTESFAEAAAKGDREHWALAYRLILLFISRIAQYPGKEGSMQEIVAGEADLMHKLSQAHSPAYWVQRWEEVQKLFYDTERLNLDKKQAVLSLFNNMTR